MVGLALFVLFVIAYVVVASSYRADIDEEFTPPTPPEAGVTLVFAPTQMSPDQRTVYGEMILSVDPQLTNSEGELKQKLEVELYPTLSDGALTYPAGQKPSPVTVWLPTAGIVQQYPFDHYALAFSERASTANAVGETTPVASQVALFFRVPGWTYAPSTVTGSSTAAAQTQVSGTFVRSFSTKLIAILLLVLMIVLAVIAVIVVQSSASGSIRLELAVA